MVAAGDRAAAAAAAAQLIDGSFGLPVAAVELTVDEYSLNSVSGRVRFADRHTEFFKFHAEAGEEDTVAEYYRAQLLAEAGLPVDVPLRVATEPGRQIALGLAQAVLAGSEPAADSDPLTAMLDAVTPA
jgi:hypothetical protein